MWSPSPKIHPNSPFLSLRARKRESKIEPHMIGSTEPIAQKSALHSAFTCRCSRKQKTALYSIDRLSHVHHQKTNFLPLFIFVEYLYRPSSMYICLTWQMLELEIKHKHGGFNINYEKATVVWQQFGFGL
jgi:hypothetical protein